MKYYHGLFFLARQVHVPPSGLQSTSTYGMQSRVEQSRDKKANTDRTISKNRLGGDKILDPLAHHVGELHDGTKPVVYQQSLNY